MFIRVVALAWLTVAVACAGGDSESTRQPPRGEPVLLVYDAAAISRPMRAVLDSFAARTGVRYEQETAASLEVARKVLELGGRPDVIALADPEIFPKLLMPTHATWYALFARNRLVLAYTPRSRFAAEIDSANWPDVIQRPGVEVGRADPNTDPSGYRTLLVWQLAERYYRQPGLAQRLLASAPARNVRPREADQVALLEAGEYDYIWTYQNLAENAGFRYVKLPNAVDLGEPADSATYALAETRVHGRRPGDTLVVRGRPILFAVTVPPGSPHADVGEQFVSFLLSPDGRGILHAQHFDALGTPLLVGSTPPAPIAAAAARR
jgi:molybdate/tungstate transport system substrate-binding protein